MSKSLDLERGVLALLGTAGRRQQLVLLERRELVAAQAAVDLLRAEVAPSRPRRPEVTAWWFANSF